MTDTAQTNFTLSRVALWTAFYRANPHRFVKDYLWIDLKLFQQIILFMMFFVDNTMYLASRGQGKSFLLAIFCCVKCILWPGTEIVIASKTRKQANEVLEKIMTVIGPKSPNLMMEIDVKHSRVGGQDSYIMWRNGSKITVATANENARHFRAHVLIIDEYRMTPLHIINDVLKRFLTASRQPGYLSKPKYKDRKDLLEPMQQLYASSCWYTSHWSYNLAQDYAVNMLNPNQKYFICSLPYQIAIKEGLLASSTVQNDMSESTFNDVTFQMEMEALWWDEGELGFYHFDEIDGNRKILYPWLRDSISSQIGSGGKHLSIPNKLKGEKRLLSADLALVPGQKNDATSIFITQLQPGTAGKYARNVVYTDAWEGGHTSDQALAIRKLFAEYDCDYIVIDCKGVGLGIVDLLMRDQYDPQTGLTYPALASCNDLMSDRNQPGAPKVLWPVAGSANFNSECALALRESFRNGSMRLLISDYDCEDELMKIPGYSKLDLDLQTQIKLPYLQTALLINELVNLEYETKNGVVKIKERAGMRKDRYSSLSYNNYVANQLERNLLKRATGAGYAPLFNFRKPTLN